MKRRFFCLSLTCLLLIVPFTACEAEDAAEMTAVPIGTEKATEKADVAQTGETTEKRADPLPSNGAATQRQTETQTQMIPSEDPTQPPVTESSATETEASTQSNDELRELARLCINSDVSVLYSLIGYPPNGSFYEDVYDFPNDGKVIGQTGSLYYDGFTVYTYCQYGAEIVTGVS